MHAFVRNGDILGDLFLPEPDKANGVGIVWCPGLPNNPIAEDMATPLSNAGFVVLQARYPGSWKSYGKFGTSSSLQGAILGLELLSKRKTEEIAFGKEVNWSLNRLVLVGNSYGGGVAISALAISNLADSAVAFCPMIEPTLQNNDPTQPEDDLKTYYPYLKKCYENVFRGLDESEWNDYIDGKSILYPPAYIEKFLDRKLLLVHGQDDKTIRSYHTEEFYKSLKNVGAKNSDLLLVDGVGHRRALRSKTWDYWTKWLLN